MHPREFDILWHLLDQRPRELDARAILVEVFQVRPDLETQRVAVHVARIRAKLKPFGLDGIVKTSRAGGYYIGEDHDH